MMGQSSQKDVLYEVVEGPHGRAEVYEIQESPSEIVYEVRRGDGSIITRTPPRPVPPDGHGVRGDVFKLTLNRPGSYELRLQARDPASSEEAVAVERFEVLGPAPAPTR